jgi:hypothetical protein
MQTVAGEMARCETLFSQANCMASMCERARMDTHMGAGFFAGLKRSFSMLWAFWEDCLQAATMAILHNVDARRAALML